METFAHIKTVIAIILTLSVAHLLKGAVKLVQHPGREKAYYLHLLWVFYIFIMLIHFWWWEVMLETKLSWTFPEYLFIIGYIMLYFVICALLFPDDLKDYTGFEDYFFSRRKWFFGVLAIIFLVDFADTLLKGKDYLHQLGPEYPVRNISHAILCGVAAFTTNRKFHTVMVILFIVYEISFVLRLYYRP